MKTFPNWNWTPKIATLFASLMLLPLACQAKFAPAQTETVPLDRLLANLDRRILEHKNDAEINYALARVHSMAFALDTNGVEVVKESGLPFYGYASETKRLPPLRPGLTGGTNLAAKAHLDTAITLYRRAAELKKDNLPAQLGLGWCLDQSGDKPAAVKAYRKALALAWKQESTGTIMAGGSVTEEIVDYLVPLLDPVKDAGEIKKIRKYKSTIAAKPRAFTPILIPLDGAETGLEALVDPLAKVAFDLDGSNLPRQWGWITPKAGWLVYDHDGKGKITSGLQLVGSVTFWIFWENGYHALSALDDNGDGILTGDELKGLALWQDSNGNGISDPGEVRSLASLGITSLSANYQTHKSGIAFNPQGVTFKDGTKRPTYDWIAHSKPK